MRLSDIRITVRRPDSDVDKDILQFDEYDDDAYITGTSKRVSGIVEFGRNMRIPVTEYIDWWGDGGDDPTDVVTELLFKALKSVVDTAE